MARACPATRVSRQRRAVGPAQERSAGASAPPIVDRALRSPGRPLDSVTRTSMETRLGHDFGRVRVHTDALAAESAASVDALAYAVGEHVVFGAGRFAPASAAGERLLA